MDSPRLRPAVADDYATFVRFFTELGVSDPVPDYERWSELMAPTTGFLEREGLTVGYAYWQPQGPLGYVTHVVVAPEQRGRRLGYSLMSGLKRELLAAGCTRWCLNVKTSNTSARRLYRGVGMSDAYFTHVMRIEWAQIGELPAPEAGVVAGLAPMRDDRRVEQSFDLGQGRLEQRRRVPGIVIVTASLRADPTRATGLAVFDSNFPGAFPFRAASPGTARALLELLERYRRPEHTELQLVIEDDATLNASLVTAGARPVFELVHMTGDLA